ncbi:MAG TPA: isoleucine--tRNA ligase [Chloroflexota bacterium]|nr:isoleucine--tRNA ligase [Chloroflexota bacterium]
MFKPVASKPDFTAMELKTLDFWKESRAFDQLVRQNQGRPRFSFIDGPITANNPMGVHHAWGRTYKDIFQRYQAMLGKDERYQNGFDCQGLWVEVEVEKDLGLNSKREIEAYGLAQFSERCRERVCHFAGVQTEQSIRLGQWMHWDHSYYTMTDQNIEYIWHFLKVCQEKGWLRRGARSLPWCTRCGTSLSQHELIDSYREVTHLSVTLKLPLKGRPNESILVWTTTPWTLPANVAAAVHPDRDYVAVRQGDQLYYLAKGTVGMLRGPYTVERTLKGSELVGLEYVAPFAELPVQRGVVHRIVRWYDVSELEGTGIVHIAPGCGAEDYELSKIENLSVIVPIDDAGNYFDGFAWLSRRNVGEVAPLIVNDLAQRGLLYVAEDYTHRYPVCWRCATELVFKLADEWFISAEQVRPLMIQAARAVAWVPEWAGKRMEDWLNNMGDWSISRKRYWGLPLPFYICDCGELTVVGSKAELESLAVSGLDQLRELHRPWIDEVKIRCPKCGSVAARIPEVGDCWLDAGIVPFSTLDYLTDRAYWEKWFPADLVLEMREQIRLWFYSMLFMSVTLVGTSPYQRVFVYEKVFDEFGRPMHKSAGNAISFSDAVEKMGADVMRWIYCSANPESNLNFGYGLADETRRKLLTLWNVYSFFVTYANIDGFDPNAPTVPVAQRPALDRWILARLQEVTDAANRAIGGYDPIDATRGCEAFFEDLSNWYLRRSRRRFWKSEVDVDKAAAYQTLYETLVQLTTLLAPIVPFLSEELYQNLVRTANAAAPASVHLNPYPRANAALLDEQLLRDTALVRAVVELGRSARSKAALKVRQPLGEVLVKLPEPSERPALERLAGQIEDELNVKQVTFVSDLGDLVEYTVKGKPRLLGPKYQRELPNVMAALKAANATTVAREVEAGKPVTVAGFVLTPEEVEVVVSERPGLSVATENNLAVAVATTVTPLLRQEGQARELVHRLQTMRKAADFRIEERITTYYVTTDPALKEVFERFAAYVKQETLSRDLCPGAGPADAYREFVNLDGHPVTLAVSR